MSDIKVFRLNDCDWYAGRSLEECVVAYAKECGASVEDAKDDDARELTDAEMERLQFIDGKPGEKDAVKRSFKDQLALMIAEGTEFPAFFASTEF